MAKKGTCLPRSSHSTSSAAAFNGVIGVPDPGRGPDLHDGGIRNFCRTFNRVSEAWLESRSVESRQFARNERFFAAALR